MDNWGLPSFFESDRIHVTGLVVADYTHEHSHWNSESSLSEWLREEGIPAISGVDTRAITKAIRSSGAQLAKIEIGDEKLAFDDPMQRNLVAEASRTEVQVFGKGNPLKILAVDCGMKNNIIRCLVERGAEVTVVPWDHDLAAEYEKCDGLFISNGPGNPEMAQVTIDNLRPILAADDVKPTFGICMGNQLVCIAAGGSTYKLPYGNRGQNIPVTNTVNKSCIITPQNHGYAVDGDSLPEGWKTLFVNENDFTNEGTMHETKPIFTAQFHPEARGGPVDSAPLFDQYLQTVKDTKAGKTWTGHDFGSPPTLIEQNVKKVLILGSGGLSIGQAGEFDYSGNQAIKALKEEGIEVVLMNPNIASVQTNIDKDSGTQADAVYSLPVTSEFVAGVIKKEKPDAMLISMGGQTALNTGVEMFEAGTLDELGVSILGTQIDAVMNTEDRQLFCDRLNEIDERIAESYAVDTLDDAQSAATTIGFPVMIRSAYALGGLGSGICYDPDHLDDMARKAFSVSPQILVEKSMLGWKEVEYEVVRDAYDNCVTVCNMENFDPLGVHTGDSIVIAPSQTLSNDEYHMLRETAIKVVKHLNIIGECNIQYALHPHSKEYCIIEVNPRLSRSSALASKATGYPLAFVAAKLALGKPLPELRNAVTKSTTACFEPSLDYVVTKIPRWDLKKFHQVSKEIGSAMKSVGEVMAIGRTFEESMQKAIRMVDPASQMGFESNSNVAEWSKNEILHELQHPTDQRVFAIARLLYSGEMTVDEIHEFSKIDKWFLSKLQRIANVGNSVAEAGTSIEEPLMRQAKLLGFSDEQIGGRIGMDMLDVRALRKGMGVVPAVKQIDTLAAEFPAPTNYLYTTYQGQEDDVEFDNSGTIVLGCGAYRIGSSVEFDWCAVSAIRTLRQLGEKSIMVNYNPETVSTDYDECDRLYFEELSLERVMDIYDKEGATGVMVSVGGQIPQNLAVPLENAGAKVLGTPPASIDMCEDRNKFSAMLDRMGIDQPAWEDLTSIDSALSFAKRVSYPVLVRPSYVLSGAAMKVASDDTELRTYLKNAAEVSKDYPVVVSKFIEGCLEVENDAVALNGEIIAQAVSEHVENAGVHSGDATHVLPPHTLSAFQVQRVRTISQKIVRELNVTGPFNIQYLAKGADLKVIECNMRASRSVPFVSKTVQCDFIQVATKAMLGAEITPEDNAPDNNSPIRPTEYVGVKVPMFSFTRLRGADPMLSVEMASTGEVACFGSNVHEAYLKGLLATRMMNKLPEPNANILLSFQEAYRDDWVHCAYQLHKLGFNLLATEATHAFLQQNDIPCTRLHWPTTPDVQPNCYEHIRDGKIDMVINLPNDYSKRVEDNYLIRRLAVDYNVPLLNNNVSAKMFVNAIEQHMTVKPLVGVNPESLFEHYEAEGNSDAWVEPREFH
jgi:carbamoyl-phosphate synthase (ammonia)